MPRETGVHPAVGPWRDATTTTTITPDNNKYGHSLRLTLCQALCKVFKVN